MKRDQACAFRHGILELGPFLCNRTEALEKLSDSSAFSFPWIFARVSRTGLLCIGGFWLTPCRLFGAVSGHQFSDFRCRAAAPPWRKRCFKIALLLRTVSSRFKSAVSLPTKKSPNRPVSSRTRTSVRLPEP